MRYITVMSKCRNCNSGGHMLKSCPVEKILKCNNCKQEGHKTSECPNPKRIKSHCRVCGSNDHRGNKCPSKVDSVTENKPCKLCNEQGHKSKHCERVFPTTILRNMINVKLELDDVWKNNLILISKKNVWTTKIIRCSAV